MLVTGISLLLTIYSAFLQHRSAQHEMGGSLMASFYQRSLNNREARTIVVCMEDVDVNLKGLYVTPTFDNPSEFSIKDLSLSFDVQCSNVSLVPSSFVETHSYGGNEWLYRYKDNLLAAHDDTKRIFTDYNVTGKTGHCFIETKASYDGASAAFEYNTDVWFLIVPKKRAQSYEDWKVNCKKRIFEVISDKYYDVYYYSHDNTAEYQFDVALVNDIDAVAPTPSPQLALKSAPQKEVKPQPVPQSSKSVGTKPKETTATAKKEETKTNLVDVKPAIKNQEINIVKYSSSKKGDRFSIEYELDKVPTSSAEYLLYGHYMVQGHNTPYLISSPITVGIATKYHKHSFRGIDSLAHQLTDLRIIAQTKADGLVEIGKNQGRRTFKNISNNKIVIVAYTSSNSYRSDELEKSEVFYDVRDNDGTFFVFDTGEKSTQIVKGKKNNYFSDMTWDRWLVLIMGGVGFVFITCFICEVEERKSLSAAWNAWRKEFSASIYGEIFWVIMLILPIFTVFVIIQYIMSLL